MQKFQIFLISLFFLLGISTMQAQVLEYVGMQADSLEGNIHYSTISPDGKFLYSCMINTSGTAVDAVVCYSRDTTTGQLTFLQKYYDDPTNGSLLDLPPVLKISPDQKHAYVPAIGDDAVTVFTRNATTGALTFLVAYQDGVGGVDGLNGAVDLSFSSDGKYAYVVGRNEDALAVFARNDTTGALTFLEVHRDGLAGVDGLDYGQFVVISDDDKHVYVSARNDRKIAIFSRNTNTGLLSYEGADTLPSTSYPNELVISPDNRYLYLASSSDSSIYVLSRNTTTGLLALVQRFANNVGTPVTHSLELVIPVGRPYLYGAGINGITVYNRDVNTGLISFNQILNTNSSFRGAILSPDNKFLYAGCPTDTSLYIYQDTTIQVTVSIENTEDKSDVDILHIFPNPASDYINIQVSAALENKQLRVRLYALNGQLMKELELTVQNALLQLNLKDLPAGKYLLQAGEQSKVIVKQ